MFDRSSQIRHKAVVAVRVALTTGAPFPAFVYLKANERLSDLLNDERAFVPVRREDGSTLIVAKSAIASIAELAPNAPAASDFPQTPEPPPAPGADALPPGPGVTDESFEGLSAGDTLAGEDGATPEDVSAEAAEGMSRDDAAEPSPDNGAKRAQPPSRTRRALDPYALLRVPRGASLDEVKRAYKARIKAVHPDTLASLHLDPDMARIAHLTAQRINHAYERILTEFDNARAEEAGTPDEANPPAAAPSTPMNAG